ncbi:hypothetical protein POJ06DRAFT_295476 [Lipomyces tetrasporus]|uniref:HNH nuclease domain-containing protein n=1 Tax=Lipomyces tetrasporus TaxID=54092 RepID=A0AAD7VT07_9ASCO|nr:uncharacterized protein POJ06DRAFT_295476 [Lipomyces tetrasporus]KAJ8100511.1 hypothetical protein POJ06DRAFT_295476 [Lipomyces tetrasporus]
MAGSRAIGRDVHFYLFSEPDNSLGGMILNPSVTEKGFLSMLNILIVHYDALKPGHYDIRPYSRKDAISITDEPWIARILSKTVTGRDDFFRARVRERDGKCVITGVVNAGAYRNDWVGFETARIFPLSSEEYWVQSGYSTWITKREGEQRATLQSHIHQKFDSFSFSINPDDGYKITCFDEDSFRIDGKILDPICRESSGEAGARDNLLRWHFRQAVLANNNMRGAGEAVFEMDFPPGTDMMGDILGGPEAGKRMEAELFSRLNGQFLV